jgi:hypothetical protein
MFESISDCRFFLDASRRGDLDRIILSKNHHWEDFVL